MVAPTTASGSIGGNKVRVVARIRPLSTKEKNEGSHEMLRVLQGNGNATSIVQVNAGNARHNGQASDKKWFELDAALDGASTQKDVYEASGARHAVTTDLFEGFNTSILAYGQTGAGKTFTMGTAATTSGEAEQLDEGAGIIPRACADLFASLRDKCLDGSATVTLSYLELYNEQIRDLFAPAATKSNSAKASNSGLRIRETPGGGVTVQGIVEKTVHSPAEIGAAMEVAGKRRVTAVTAMNATSSRSHAICTLRVQGTLKGASSSDDEADGSEPADSTTKFSSKLTLVDLAGSERIKKTGAKGARQTEGININKSLLVLGQVVSALSQGSGSRKPPYRDSKLTRLLQDSLGGNSRTIMLACVSPAHVNLDETTNTLRYASSARRITNRARQNVATTSTLTAAQAAALRQENTSLQQQVAALQASMQVLQQQLLQVKEENQQAKSAEAQEKRGVPSRSVSQAVTATTAALSDDEDDFDVASFDEEVNKERTLDTEDEGEADSQSSAPQQASIKNVIPEQINVDSSAAEVEDTVSTKEEEGAPEPEEGDETGECGDSNAGTESIDNDDDLQSLSDVAAKEPKKSTAENILDISSHKLAIAQLKERQDFYELLEGENDELRRALNESKAEADTARMAATYLSDIVDELRDIKRGEIDKKQQQLKMSLKEQNWISFVQVMLENYRTQVGNLSNNFNRTVVPTMENLELTAQKAAPPTPTADATTKTTDSPVVAVTPGTTEETSATGEESQEQAAEAAPPERRKVSRRRSWWGGTVEVVEPAAPAPWKQVATQFEQDIRNVEYSLVDEAQSLQLVLISLVQECTALETDIGARELENESLFASSSGANGESTNNDLVDHLSSMLLQRQVL
jgi:hypothetical protein